MKSFATATPSASNGKVDAPDQLRAYRFHGIDLQVKPGAEQATGDCPFCGREGKFTVSVKTGLWRCWVCDAGNPNGGGNLTVFLRTLWDRSDAATNGASKELAEARGLLYPETVTLWGVCQSIVTKEWLVPGWSPDGRLTQLYRWVPDRRTGKMLLLATPGVAHALHGVNRWNPKADEVFVCEGWGDALTLWETLKGVKRTDGGGLETTGSPASSLLAGYNVLGVPGCTVFPDHWASMFAGKTVNLMYDNDHPRENGARAGWDGAKHAARVLASAKNPPRAINVLWWGEQGHDPNRNSGCDVREVLSAGASMAARVPLLGGLLGALAPVPDEWVGGGKGEPAKRSGGGGAEIDPAPCDDWGKLLNAWRKALAMRQDIEDVLAVSLAVAASTDQAGDQLFLQMIGDPGSAKTKVCEALLVSKHCHALEHLTGFHSGWKGEGGEDCSLIARINHKTLVTPEGDVIMSGPKFQEIMSQQRRIFDGTSGATYKNSKEDVRYVGLRTPWIIAGTPALMDQDQSRLGDRFLRVVINRPTEDEEDAILDQTFFASQREIALTSNCSPETCLDDAMLDAYRMTGGYVNWLRLFLADKVSSVLASSDEDYVRGKVKAYAKFAADLRARPSLDLKKHDANNTKELPSRLTKQLARLSFCLAVVLSQGKVDAKVMRVVRKVALDTARGKTFKIVRALRNAAANDPKFKDGADVRALAVWTHDGEDRLRSYMGFLDKIGVCESWKPKNERHRWRLTARMKKLYEQVVENGG